MESRIKGVQEEISREESEIKELAHAKNGEVISLRDNLSKLSMDYEELMSTKTDLETEIKTYRRLLEGEEDRFFENFYNLMGFVHLDSNSKIIFQSSHK